MPRDSPAAGSRLLGLALVWGLAWAGRAAAGDQPAQLDLFVNGAPHGVVLVVLRGDDALVAAGDLSHAGLRGFDGRRETYAGRTYVSLSSLAPLLRFEVDERALALRITAEASLLGFMAFDLSPVARPPGLTVRGDPSGFLNYSAQLQTGGQLTGFAEAGGGFDGKLLYASGSLLAGGQAIRDLTSLTIDEPGALRRWIAGDVFAAAGGLGGGVFLGGLSLVKEYGLDPYQVRGPLPRLSGFAPTPSTLDVYVNGVLVRQQPLPPGGYDLANLPVTSGAGNVRTVLRDALGRTEDLSWSYYYGAGLLGRGLADYGYHLGFERRRYGQESFDYGRPLLVARHRLGITDELTLGGRLEAGEDLISGGPAATLGLPWGELELSAAASRQAGASGAAGSLAYSFSTRRFSGTALVRAMTDHYANASRSAADDRPRVQASATVGVAVLPRVGVTANYTVLDYRDFGFSDSASVQTSFGLAQDLSLIVNGSCSRPAGGSPALGLFATLSWVAAPATVADASLQSGAEGTGVSAGVQRSLPAGTGFGYRARVVGGPGPEGATGLLQYQWDYGRYELQYDRYGSSDIGTATATGGMAFIGGRFFLARPIQDAFALMRVGAPGVRGFVEGQEIGRTDSRGDLLVPNLLPYYGNRLSIAEADVPMDYRMGATQQLAAPTWRLGTLVPFDLQQIRTLTGELVVEVSGREVLPAYGELVVQVPGGEASSPVGRDGRFYFENLPPGRYPAQVEWKGGGRCQLFLEAPEAPPHADLGRLRCRAGESPPSSPALPPTPTPASPEPTPGATLPGAPVPTAAAPVADSQSDHRPTLAIPAALVASPVPAVEAPPPWPTLARATTVRGRASPQSAVRHCPPCDICFEAAMERERRAMRVATCTGLLVAATRQEPRIRSEQEPDLQESCDDCLKERRSLGCP